MPTTIHRKKLFSDDLLTDRTALFRQLSQLTVQPPVFAGGFAELVGAGIADPDPAVLETARDRAQGRIDLLSLKGVCDCIFETVMDIFVRISGEEANLAAGSSAGKVPGERPLRAAACAVGLLGELFATIGQEQPAQTALFKSLIYPKPAPSSRIRAAIGMPDFGQNQDLLLDFMRANALRIIALICVAADRAGELRSEESNAGADGRVSVDFLADVLAVPPQVHRRQPTTSIAAASAELVWLGVSGPVAVGGAKRAPAVPSATAADAARWRQQASDLDAQVTSLRLELATEKARNDEEGLQPQYAEQLRGLRARLHWLEQTGGGSGDTGQAAAAEVPPTGWDELWPVVERQMAGRLVITRKAARAARRSHYQDVPFAWRVIRLLAEDYVPMRRGEPGARERFEENCKELKVAVSPTGKATVDRKFRDAYQVNHLGQYLTLDLHVQGSDSRDPLECFRLYFTYAVPEDGLGYVLVGHLPSHLENSLE